MKSRIAFSIFITVWVLGLFVIPEKLSSADLYTYGGMSYEYNKGSEYCNPEEDWFTASIASGIEQDVSPFTLFLEAELETEMFYSSEGKQPTWEPTHQDYYVRGGVSAFFLQVGYEHLCMHNVDSINTNRNGGHDALYIKFDSRGF